MYSLSTQKMIDRLGLPNAFRILAGCSFFANFIASILLKDRNKAIGTRHAFFHLPLSKRPEFILLQGWAWGSLFGYTALLFSIVNYSVTIGLTPSQASLVGAMLNLGQGLGRPIVGLVSDRVGRINIAAALTFVCGVFCLVIWIFAKSLGVMIFFAVIVGTVAGTFWTTIAPVGAEVVGLKDLPSALSITWVMLVPTCTVAEPIALVLRQQHSSNVYLHPQVWTGFTYIAAALCLWIVRGWKVGELEALARQKEAIDRRATDESFATDSEEPEEKVTGSDLARTNSRKSSTDIRRDPDNWRPKDLLRRMNAWKVV